MNEQERFLFDLQGFLVVPNALSADELARLNAAVDEEIEQNTGKDMRTHRFGGLLDRGTTFHFLIDNPRITPYLDELLGVMANGTYCLMLRNFDAIATVRFGQDLRNQHTGETLSQLYSLVASLPLKLQ